MKRYVSAADVAAEFGCSIRTAYRMMRRMTRTIDGRLVRVTRAAFEAYLRRREVQPLDAAEQERDAAQALAMQFAKTRADRLDAEAERDAAAERSRYHHAEILRQRDLAFACREKAEAERDAALEEVEAYRGGLAAGFGTATADPHGTLTNLGHALERHHQEHHAAEDRLTAERDAARAALRPLARALDDWPYGVDRGGDIGRMNYNTGITPADVERAKRALGEEDGGDDPVP